MTKVIFIWQRPVWLICHLILKLNRASSTLCILILKIISMWHRLLSCWPQGRKNIANILNFLYHCVCQCQSYNIFYIYTASKLWSTKLQYTLNKIKFTGWSHSEMIRFFQTEDYYVTTNIGNMFCLTHNIVPNEPH